MDTFEAPGKSANTVSVAADGDRFELRPGDEFTFGRSQRCTLCLDPLDVGISRTAGCVEYAEGTWWLRNRSESRSFDVVRNGIRSVAGPRVRHAVDGELLVVVTGSEGRHYIELTGPELDAPAETTMTGLPTAVGQDVKLNQKDRLALAVLFEGYLRDGAAHDPWPRTYDSAVARLGWTRAALVHRIDYLRERLRKAGVPNLYGQRAMAFLAEHVLTTGMLTKADLELLER